MPNGSPDAKRGRPMPNGASRCETGFPDAAGGLKPGGSRRGIPAGGFPPGASPGGFPPKGSRGGVPAGGFPAGGSRRGLPAGGFPPGASRRGVPAGGLPPGGSRQGPPAGGFPPGDSHQGVPTGGFPPKGSRGGGSRERREAAFTCSVMYLHVSSCYFHSISAYLCVPEVSLGSLGGVSSNHGCSRLLARSARLFTVVHGCRPESGRQWSP